ncbi:MAG: class I SAM-dependent methyltransferase [Dehalococcoidia bacterium]
MPWPSRLKTITPRKRARLLAGAGASPFSNPRVQYPEWYIQRWHFIPDGYFSPRAIGLYDRWVRRLYHGLDESRIYSRIVTLLESLDPQLIAEFGCGPGHALAVLARSFPSARLTGTDLSPFMLEAASRRLPSGVTLVHADACRPVLAAEEADAILAVHVLGHIPRSLAGRMAGQARRALRPGGLLLTVDHRWHPEVAQDHFRLTHSELVSRRTARLALWRKHDRT